jgi:hypothetical protein
LFLVLQGRKIFNEKEEEEKETFIKAIKEGINYVKEK